MHSSLRGEPEARGPAAARFPAVALAERAHLGHHALRGRHAELAGAVQATLALRLPEVPNTVSAAGDLLCAWLSPSEWLLVDDDPPRKGARAALIALADRLPPDRSALVDLGSAHTVIALRGPGARELLSSGCPLDVHPRSLPPGSCAQSHLAKAPITLICRPAPHAGLELVVRRSYAPYVWGWLTSAAALP